MDRRIALKNMGFALGLTVATPTLISIVQSCKTKETTSWVPGFFSPEEGKALTKLVDILLPKTDTPSASELNVHVFIDEYVNKVMEVEMQQFTKLLMGSFLDKAMSSSGKESVGDLETEDLEAALASSLKAGLENAEAHEKAMGQYMEAMAKGEEAELDQEAASANFASTLRDFTIYSYKTTEYIGENVLVYQSIPGEYIGCGDLDELTGGKAYSLDGL